MIMPQGPPSASPPGLLKRLEARARELGFDRLAVVPAQRLPHAQAFDEWLAEGRHGQMDYMARHTDLRLDPQQLEPGTRSVIVVLKNYRQPLDLLPGGLRISRYAQGDDYHEELRPRLRELAAFLHAETGVAVVSRPAVDSAPLLERDLAALAGLGWVGKNAMLIAPGLGSYTFIAELLVDLDLAQSHPPQPDRCGRCTRCMDACPTGAIVSPYLIDARRCISYLTIELRGPIPRALRSLMGDYLYGCDICQDVCPWNRKAPQSEDPRLATREIYRTLTLRELLQFDAARYAEVFRRSAIKRTKRAGLLRNAAVVMGNTGDAANVPFLAERLGVEPEPLVRGHLAWALGKLGGWQALQMALQGEGDPYVREEIRAALEDRPAGGGF